MLKKIIIVLSLIFALQAEAGIKVYDPVSGKEQSLDSLMDADVLDSVDTFGATNMRAGQKQNLVKKDIKYRMRKIDAEIAAKKEATKYGSVYVFVDTPSFTSKMGKAINKIAKIEGVGKGFYLKQPKNPISYLSLTVEMGDNLDAELSVDDGKYARKFHVTRYPEVIYVSPEGVKSRYGLTLGSVMALKLRIQELANVKKYYQ